MSGIKRRQFLQFAGSTLATLGLSHLDIQQAGNRYARVLAQGTPRKLALLVGINKYQDAPLQGCVTDVMLQKQLLIHRFGFNPKDILILTDEQATRQGILTAFEEHLIKQAKPNDVVVYHFSGHGSLVADLDFCLFKDEKAKCVNGTFVPIDSAAPTNSSQGGSVQDIMGHTLFLLMSALQTENVTVVLDSCHSGAGTRGNFRIRSRSGGSQLQPVDAERAYQQQWLQKLNLSPEEFKRRLQAGIAKGVVIASTKPEQPAADAPFNDFFAGVFTYLMTQYLWQQPGTESFTRFIPNVARSTTRLSFTQQVPQIECKPGSDYCTRPVYFIEKQTPPAEAVITKVEGNQAELWLGGINHESLAAFDAGAILSAVDAQGQEKGRVQLENRDGLVGKAKLLDSVPPGALLQERTRSISSNLTLKIGLDSSLGNQATQAKQALASIPRIEALALQQQEVQYIFGRLTDTYKQQLQFSPGSKPPEVGSFGLFSPALEVIPDSFGANNESITDAINRLRSKFQSLLAAHIIKTALNANSSRLNIVASMRREEDDSQILGTIFTPRGNATPANPPLSGNISKLPLKTAVQLVVENNETSNLYVTVLVIDPAGAISVVFPNSWATTESATLMKASQTLKIPDPVKDNFRLVTQEPKGFTEVLVLASRKPLNKALQTLRNIAAAQGSTTRGGPVSLGTGDQKNASTEVINNLLDDVDNAITGGAVKSATPSSSSDRSLDTTQLAALSITFEVI
jgi:hypothetical protein